MYRLAACLIGVASLLLQNCSESRFKDCDRLCGSWNSVEDEPNALIYKGGDVYKMTVPARSDEVCELRPETYLLVEGNGNLLTNTGYRMDIAYNEVADILVLSSSSDYVRKEVRP